MHSFRRESGHADGNVLRAFIGGGVLYPLSRMRDYCLPGRDIEGPAAMADPQAAPQHDGVLLKIRRLAGLFPACRTSHVGHADTALPGIQVAHIFINHLGQIARGLHASRTFNQCRQSDVLHLFCAVTTLLWSCNRLPLPVCRENTIWTIGGDLMNIARFLLVLLLSGLATAQSSISERLRV